MKSRLKGEKGTPRRTPKPFSSGVRRVVSSSGSSRSCCSSNVWAYAAAGVARGRLESVGLRWWAVRGRMVIDAKLKVTASICVVGIGRPTAMTSAGYTMRDAHLNPAVKLACHAVLLAIGCPQTRNGRDRCVVRAPSRCAPAR